jgi:hypothetical protein
MEQGMETEKHNDDKLFPAGPTTPQVSQPDTVPAKTENKSAALQPQRELTPFEKQMQAELREASLILATKLVPKILDTREKVWIAMRFVREQFPNEPMSAIQQVSVFNNKILMWGELPLTKAKRTGQLKWFKNYVADKEGKKISFENKNQSEPAWAGVCEIQRDGYELETYMFSMDDAKAAGLLSKEGPWKQYPKRMLKVRARSEALKDVFADALVGAGIGEYETNETFEEIDAKPVVTQGSTAELNAAFIPKSGDNGN